MLLSEELVFGGDFAAWTADNPDSWTVVGESGNDPEISEAATGESHTDTPTLGGGMCNMYTSDGTSIAIRQTITTVVGRRYRASIAIDTRVAGELIFADLLTEALFMIAASAAGIYTTTFVANSTSLQINIKRSSGVTDITFDDVSIREDIPTELSRTGHHFSSFSEN